MKNILLLILVAMLVLTACSSARQKLQPQDNLYLKSANVYFSQNPPNVEKALEYYGKVLKDSPDYLIALKRVADINLSYGVEQPDKSVEFNTIAYNNYSHVLKVLASFPELKENERVMKTDATRRKEASWARIYKVGDTQAQNMDYAAAIETLQALYNLDKTRTEPLKRLVTVYQEQKAADVDVKVSTTLNKIMEITPNDPQIVKMMGSYYYNIVDTLSTQHYADALVYFEKVKAMDPNDVNNLMLIATCYNNLKEYRKALDELKLVLALEPDKTDAIFDARQNANAIPDLDETIKYSKLMLEKDKTPENISFLVVKLNEQKKYAEAMPYAEMWYDSLDDMKMDNLNAIKINVASLCKFMAEQIGDKDLINKYTNIVNGLK